MDFSITIETLNLRHEPIARFGEMLDSLAAQSTPPSTAREVVVLDSGEADAEELRGITGDYDWLTVIEAEWGISYDRAKMLGAESTTGEIVVFADSDCVYEQKWLESMLAPFEDPAVQVVAGETSTAVTGPYSLALAMTCCFPRYSNETQLGRTDWYEFNNVAMRRELLNSVPIPVDLLTLRGGGFLHSVAIKSAGHPIHRQPLARADHPIAGGVSHFTEHFLDRGVESACASEQLGDWSGASYRTKTRLGRVVDKAKQALDEDQRRWLWLPLALPVAAASVALYGLGRGWGVLAAVRRGFARWATRKPLGSGVRGD